MKNDIVKLNKNQAGGARPGAGRKPGSGNKLRPADFFNGEERDRLIQQAKDLTIDAKTGKIDKDMVKFLWEQLFGKATQRQLIEDEDGNSYAPLIVKILNGGKDNGDTSRV